MIFFFSKYRFWGGKDTIYGKELLVYVNVDVIFFDLLWEKPLASGLDGEFIHWLVLVIVGTTYFYAVGFHFVLGSVDKLFVYLPPFGLWDRGHSLSCAGRYDSRA